MRLVLAAAIVVGLFAVSPIAGGVAAGLVGALFVTGVLSGPAQVSAAEVARVAQIAAAEAAEEVKRQQAGGTMTCELCSETIKLMANVCRFCQAWKCEKCWNWSRAGQECNCVPCDCGEESIRPDERCMYEEDE